MKVWLKFLIGSALGIVLGILLPESSAAVSAALDWAGQMALHLGRYMLVPVLFFSLSISIFELREEKKMWPLALRTGIIILGAAIFMVTVGLIAVNLFPPARIPILIEGQKEFITLETGRNLLDLFPSNAFSALTGDGTFLLPLCVLAFFLGAGLSYGRGYAKNVASLIDALARVFYHVSSFFSEILGIVMIALGAFWAFRFRGALSADVFQDLILLLAITAVVLAVGIIPLFLYMLGPKVNPWKQLYGAIGPALAGFFSGDINFTLPVLFRHARENHGIKRRSNTFTLALFGAFGRSGSAMVAAMSLIVIIKSYSSLGVSFLDLVFIVGASILISLLLSRHPGDGAYAALAILCGMYGRGFEAGYLILKPIAFYLIAIGTFLDVVIMSLGTCAIGRLSGYHEHRETRLFI